MGINFPNTPTLGDIWPTPSVVGQPQYTWDGEKWGKGGIPASRASIYAAPFDAMAYNGMQINGSMDVSQELGTTGTTVNGGYVCDGWRLYFIGTMALIAAQQTTPYLVGFPSFLAVAINAAQPSLASNSVAQIYTIIEGRRIARLGWGYLTAQPITIGFWTAHHRTGSYSVSISNSGASRSYVATYTHNTADVWQYNTVTVPGDTAGTWLIDNNAGMNIVFPLASGTNSVASAANTWLAGNFITTSSQVNAVAATSDSFRITGVVVLPGIEAPSAARSALIMRPYDQELLTCQRYFYLFGQTNFFPVVGGIAGAGGQTMTTNLFYPVSVRATPTATKNGTWTVNNCGQPTINTATSFGVSVNAASVAAGPFSAYPSAAGQTITVDARL